MIFGYVLDDLWMTFSLVCDGFEYVLDMFWLIWGGGGGGGGPKRYALRGCTNVILFHSKFII